LGTQTYYWNWNNSVWNSTLSPEQWRRVVTGSDGSRNFGKWGTTYIQIWNIKYIYMGFARRHLLWRCLL